MYRVSFLVLLCLFQLCAAARIELPSVIGNNMVVPQNTRIRLWGWASPSEKVFVTPSWSNRTDSAVATRDAKWELWVESPAAGGPHQVTFRGSNTIVVDNILSGAVWLCSGQSNMEWNYYNGIEGMRSEIEKGNQPQIRFFQVDRKTALHPQDDVRGKWVVCDSNTLKSFSGVGYFFGSRLHDSLHVPVGLINASWGGTPAEVWMPDTLVLKNDTWKKDLEKLSNTPYWTITPGLAFNAMIAPLTPFVLDGAIWYQGESNVGAANSYGSLFSTLINSWRKAWSKELPFYFVQIAPYTYGPHFGAALLREQQARVAATLPHTGMVVVSDLVHDTTNIHPVNKRDVGYRLAALALSDAYGKALPVTSSKTFQRAETKGNKMVVSFTGNDGKLVLKGKTPQALLIAGADGVYLPAQAKVVGNNLEVWHPQIKVPQSVRYQFSSAGVGNMVDSYGLPLAPFRTDNLEL
ncbi:sialate O-acetylesterase [Cnuella takakiae]|uniref:Sialate O-acetylesterase n=1 Tax=Cnuella takakiae TaxID=1302690 RepID=A0A1M4VCQ5_9BACT|nr:sialate O-acetylesterase [Cnuella takakiae]OLY94818.1 hypothetical protein BUE76_12620 [Cnuella takakiae]SHE66761.1 sialate O-acetylesterase [Cnuella takakiae]